MPLRRTVRTVATIAAIGASAAIGALALSGTAGAVTNGQQVPGTALAQSPFTAGADPGVPGSARRPATDQHHRL
jgi:hypothetical protein